MPSISSLPRPSVSIRLKACLSSISAGDISLYDDSSSSSVSDWIIDAFGDVKVQKKIEMGVLERCVFKETICQYNSSRIHKMCTKAWFSFISMRTRTSQALHLPIAWEIIISPFCLTDTSMSKEKDTRYFFLPRAKYQKGCPSALSLQKLLQTSYHLSLNKNYYYYERCEANIQQSKKRTALTSQSFHPTIIISRSSMLLKFHLKRPPTTTPLITNFSPPSIQRRKRKDWQRSNR